MSVILKEDWWWCRDVSCTRVRECSSDGVRECNGDGVREYNGDGVRECNGDGVREYNGDGVRECNGDGVRECNGDEVRECSSDRVRECNGDGVRECNGDGVRECSGDEVRKCNGDGVRECSGDRVRECNGDGVRECNGDGVRECNGDGVRECSGDEVRKCNGDGVRECSGDRVRECICGGGQSAGGGNNYRAEGGDICWGDHSPAADLALTTTTTTAPTTPDSNHQQWSLSIRRTSLSGCTLTTKANWALTTSNNAATITANLIPSSFHGQITASHPVNCAPITATLCQTIPDHLDPATNNCLATTNCATLSYHASASHRKRTTFVNHNSTNALPSTSTNALSSTSTNALSSTSLVHNVISNYASLSDHTHSTNPTHAAHAPPSYPILATNPDQFESPTPSHHTTPASPAAAISPSQGSTQGYVSRPSGARWVQILLTLLAALPTLAKGPYGHSANSLGGYGTNQLGKNGIFVQSNNSEVTAQAGATATLPCRLSSSLSDGMISWVRRRNYQVLTVGRQVYSSDVRIGVKVSMDGCNWMMTVRFVTTQDAGLYECQVSFHPPQAITINLKVVEAHAEIMGGPERYIHHGSSLLLVCLLKGATEAPVYVFWYRDDRMINYDTERGVTVDNSRQASKLYVASVSHQDEGNYTCVPSNAAQASVVVTVIQKENPAGLQQETNTEKDASSPSSSSSSSSSSSASSSSTSSKSSSKVTTSGAEVPRATTAIMSLLLLPLYLPTFLHLLTRHFFR